MNTLSDTFLHRVRRQLSHFQQRSILPVPTEGPIVSFSFDDCPCSAIDTALPMLEAEDWKATIYVAVGLCDTVNHLGPHISRDDIVDLHKRGHEIGDHTYSHINAKGLDATKYMADVERNQRALKDLGLPPSENFAFPFGDVTNVIKKELRHKFSTLRGVLPPQNSRMDANFLPAIPIYSGQTEDTALREIANLQQSQIWLNLFTHDVRENPSPFGCKIDTFQDIVAAVKQSGARVMTVRDAYRTVKSEGSVT
ncbi:polysaccharide deacetylase family protein [Litorimonas sp. WD9-15]|uniref:polysaccharide deacetylase family protein n=1 Tax=Litorimonas sp. WD9-15 TaxID=3418716 RepID=UPI003D07CD01